jgi:hypothetical protein
LSEEGVRQQLKDYVDSAGKKIKPENGRSDSLLTAAQMHFAGFFILMSVMIEREKLLQF